ncbi:MAG: sugar transferase [Candidatus Cyclobacteriaceae bacterium M3_2C_046]
MHKSLQLDYQLLNKSPTSSKKIIYIGDLSDSMFDALSQLGYQILSFNLSFSADVWLEFTAFSEMNLPDAILCDLELPDTDAFSLFELFGKNEKLMFIPFIVISKTYNHIDKIKAFELGVDDFYPVSVSADQLDDRIAILKRIKKEKLPNTEATNTIKDHYEDKIVWPKRLFDILISLFLLILLSPLIILISILILLTSPGPVIYVSKRVGTGYKIFDFYKFRTMYKDADKRMQELIHLNQYSLNGSKSSFFKINNDPRITKIGRFLRKTSLDELPQLINVLTGDMSLVGNRPLPLYEAEQLTTDLWAKRFLAPAGITGLWQVTQRGKKDMSEQERKELDVSYADRSSFWFDISILLRTLPAVVTNRETV